MFSGPQTYRQNSFSDSTAMPVSIYHDRVAQDYPQTSFPLNNKVSFKELFSLC